MPTEKAIREAIREWYGSLYENDCYATAEALTKLDELFMKEPEEEPMTKPYGRHRNHRNTH